jgi:hypothetical protein
MGLAEAWVGLVRRCDDDWLADDVRAGVLGTPGTVPLLIALVADQGLSDEMCVVHALDLLRDVRPSEAAPGLVDLLCRGADIEELDLLIEDLGGAAVPALLARIGDHPTELACLLGACAAGSLDPVVREALVAALARDPARASAALAELGDPAAVPALLQALDAARPELETGVFAGQAVIELVGAIRFLGGDPGDMGRDKLDAMRRIRVPPRVALDQLMRGQRGSANARTVASEP